MEVHIVQKGDTLWKIARQHGVSFEELKRVNAHLANPDYIVPGMKIMLPKKQGGTGKPHAPNHGGGTPPIKKQEKQPEKKPSPPKPVEQKPKPKPQPPVPPVPSVKPTPPPAQPMPPIPEMPPQMPPQVPPMQPVPPTQQMPMVPQMPMQCVQVIPVVGIPCGCWMPHHDVDFHPHVHHHHMHHGHMPPMPPNQAPVEESCSIPPPPPPPALHMPTIDAEQEESPLPSSHGPIPVPEKWKPIESPMYLESPEIQQPMPPQDVWGPCHPGFPMNTQPMPCSSVQQYPAVPPPHPNHCSTCHQPMPIQMMPHSGQPWPGNY